MQRKLTSKKIQLQTITMDLRSCRVNSKGEERERRVTRGAVERNRSLKMVSRSSSSSRTNMLRSKREWD